VAVKRSISGAQYWATYDDTSPYWEVMHFDHQTIINVINKKMYDPHQFRIGYNVV
jgi:hypothetical protein